MSKKDDKCAKKVYDDSYLAIKDYLSFLRKSGHKNNKIWVSAPLIARQLRAMINVFSKLSVDELVKKDEFEMHDLIFNAFESELHEIKMDYLRFKNRSITEKIMEQTKN